MDFVAIDVETANPCLSSICQIGIVAFEGSCCTGAWQSLVDPEDYFHPLNVGIHGITEETVRGAPVFSQAFECVQRWLSSQIAVCHTPFDRLALARACEKYRLPDIDCRWLDSARIVRRAWTQFARSGYGLGNITEFLGIVYRAHIAQEDARAAGEVVLRAVCDIGLTIEEWVVRARQPIFPASSSTSRSTSGAIALEGNPDGPLAGEVAVFTGALSIPRREAAQAAAILGLSVAPSVNKETTFLIVGDQDLRRLKGHEKSSKHRKAEELIAKGQRIRILGESDFQGLMQLEHKC